MSTARALLGTLLFGLSACQCTVNGIDDGGAGGGGAVEDGGASGGGGGTGGGSGGGAGGSGGCSLSAQCPGGVCLDGACCPEALACGSQCCSAADVCLFGACATPGASCFTATDCGPHEYCETALAEPVDAGTPVDGGSCTQAPPSRGRCLPLAPVCSADAGTDAGCVQACEYHPPVGALTAEACWSWGPVAARFPDFTDVWSTPTVGRLHDSNCDGRIDELDAPVLVFVSGTVFANTPNGGACQGGRLDAGLPSTCHTGVLRALDGATGQELWSLDRPSADSNGFAGISVALGDVDHDGALDIVAVSAEGQLVLLDGTGAVKRVSTVPLEKVSQNTFGWGGGLSLADQDNDGFTEVAFGRAVYTTADGGLVRRFLGDAGMGGGNVQQALSTFVDLNHATAGDDELELLAGNTAYRADGTVLWTNDAVDDGLPGVGDFDGDGKPEVVVVGAGKLWLLDAETGAVVLGPTAAPGSGQGGPPTVADFDGDGRPEVGVAKATFYSVMKPDFTAGTLEVLWQTPNHDLSSSVTGSTVFDFEGDGKAEVIYADECFLWVFDGTTGQVRFAAPHTSFTGTEASLLADLDGDGHAEMVMVSNGANPAAGGWNCLDANGQPITVNGATWVPTTLPNKSYRGVTVFGDAAHSWVGTRTLWNQHTYHVSNICDDRDSACSSGEGYGAIPRVEQRNWSLPWLNNFRQNVQDHGLFDAPDAVVALELDCTSPLTAAVSVRNVGQASLPAGVTVEVRDSTGTVVGTGVTTQRLFPGQVQKVAVTLAAGASSEDTFTARVVVDPLHPRFHQCRDDNDESAPAAVVCLG